MARVKLEVEFDARQFMAMRKITEQFPLIRAQMLGYVGARGEELLYNNFLSGQELTYKGRKDSKGEDKTSHTIAKKAIAVKIRSYPANLFEKGRKLRSGATEPGKYIITRKLKSLMSPQMQNILNDFDRKYLQKKLDKI